MELNLLDNDYISNIVIYVKRGKESFYCFSDKEYWILEWWSGYVDSEKGVLEDLYFDFIQQFRVKTEIIRRAYAVIVDENDPMSLDGNLPMVYVDFDKKLFLSLYYDQALERRMIPSWEGRYENFHDLIHMEDRYWITNEDQCSTS
jgi:hypothetical protein